MFFYPYGQVSFSLTDVSCACVTQAIILIDDIGQQVHGSFAFKGEIMADLKGRINHSYTDTIIGLKHCFQFSSKYYGMQKIVSTPSSLLCSLQMPEHLLCRNFPTHVENSFSG